jgi:DNA-binding MarR family transcriptional regulator
VLRVSDPRGWRGVGVELTASGRELAAKVAAISQELDDMFFGPPLTRNDRRKLQVILTKVRDAALALPDADLTGLWQD